MDAIETDYLVIGAGAAGMAFADALIAASDAEVVLVDRRHGPGGHWHDAYPFVRLHGPSALYGVNSRRLGSDVIDRDGPNAGYYPRATAAEIQRWLATLGYAVPGIELVGVNLRTSQVRYANSADAGLAKTLADQLDKKYTGLNVQTQSIGAYAASQNIAVPLRVLELWLVSNPDIGSSTPSGL